MTNHLQLLYLLDHKKYHSLYKFCKQLSTQIQIIRIRELTAKQVETARI